MSDPFEIVDDDAREKLCEKSPSKWTAPMLATLTHDTFSDRGWIYERKLDGVRCLAFRKGGSVRLLSRNEQLMNDTYPELVDELEKQDCDDFIVDGEIVAFEGPHTSFSRLQQRIGIEVPRPPATAASPSTCISSTCCISTGTTSRPWRSTTASVC